MLTERQRSHRLEFICDFQKIIHKYLAATDTEDAEEKQFVYRLMTAYDRLSKLPNCDARGLAGLGISDEVSQK